MYIYIYTYTELYIYRLTYIYIYVHSVIQPRYRFPMVTMQKTPLLELYWNIATASDQEGLALLDFSHKGEELVLFQLTLASRISQLKSNPTYRPT